MPALDDGIAARRHRALDHHRRAHIEGARLNNIAELPATRLATARPKARPPKPPPTPTNERQEQEARKEAEREREEQRKAEQEEEEGTAVGVLRELLRGMPGPILSRQTRHIQQPSTATRPTATIRAKPNMTFDQRI
jgi:hypothetical protein